MIRGRFGSLRQSSGLGHANCCLSTTKASEKGSSDPLLRTGTITDTDFLGTQKYRMADGSSVPSQQFMIRSLKVGDRTLNDVTGSIAPVEGGLLLGQSFLRRFKSWSIDNQREALILN